MNNKIHFVSKKSKFLLQWFVIIHIVETIELIYKEVHGHYFLPLEYLPFSLTDTVFYLFVIQGVRNISFYVNYMVIFYIIIINIFYIKEYHFYFIGVDYFYNVLIVCFFYRKFIMYLKEKPKRFFVQNKFFVYFIFTMLYLAIFSYALASINHLLGYFLPNFEKGFLYGVTPLIYLFCFSFLIKEKISFVFKEIRKINYFSVVKKRQNEIFSISEKSDFDELTKIINSQRIYRNPKVTIQYLSVISNMHVKYISKIVNYFTGNNFNDFINKFRVEEFKKNIIKEEYNNYSIFGVAEESGFSSKSTFYKVFKKHELMSPTEYMKKIEMSEIVN